MRAFTTTYLISLLILAVLDFIWLTTTGKLLYMPAMGSLMRAQPDMVPAVAFYLIYPAGLVFFAVVPALKSGSISIALMNGALFGFFAYATYELTNFATLRNWTLQITLVDIAYGAVVSGAVAAAVTALLQHWRA